VRQLNKKRRPYGSARRVLALAVCLLTVFFIVVSSSHIHADGRSDTACPICQAAHIGISAAVGTAELPAPLIQRSEPPPSVAFAHTELFLSSAASRAPPSA
jgi:hypothetical protein